MKSFILVVFLFALVFSAQGEDTSGDLSSLSAKFQSLISELGEGDVSRNDYKTEISDMLEKLDRFQSHVGNQTISLEWFSGTFEQGVPMRVVIVASSFEGVYLNSGIGTFYAAMCEFLINRGHTVTILYTRTDRSDSAINNFNRWQKKLREEGSNCGEASTFHCSPWLFIAH